jgi:hypothetical protein
MESGRGGESVESGHVDVEYREVGPLRQGGGHDGRAVRHLGDDLDVILQVQHGNQHVAQNPHVLRDKDPDHRASRLVLT